jgi:hypothetical protein
MLVDSSDATAIFEIPNDDAFSSIRFLRKTKIIKYTNRNRIRLHENNDRQTDKRKNLLQPVILLLFLFLITLTNS